MARSVLGASRLVSSVASLSSPLFEAWRAAKYGNASGPVEPFNPGVLAPKGSLYVTRPTLATHISTRELLLQGAERLIDAVAGGQIHISVNQTLPLAQCAEAHRQLEARETTGSTVLTI